MIAENNPQGDTTPLWEQLDAIPDDRANAKKRFQIIAKILAILRIHRRE
jgi:hypothetical protein